MSDLQTDVLADLVAKCLEEMSERDGQVSVEEICAEHPELIEEVRMSVELAGDLPRIQAVGLAKDDFIGEVLAGRYRVDSRIGSGAMGVVYSGTDLELGRRVAVKVVHARFLDREQALARFDREAAALAAISHDSVVTIFDRGVTDAGAPFLVMERVEGVSCSEILTLAERHRSGDSTEWLSSECGIENVREASLVRQMVRWAAGLASGLEAAHTAGVYHRDVKPSNIMIRLDGRPVLLDFGIAAIENEGTLTRTEAAVGTPAYMAPEVLFGGKNRNRSRAGQDVYGLAATLYHLLTLTAPYKGSPTEILAALATREPVPAFKVRPGLPRDAQAILDHGLARSPGARYATPAAMEEDLRALLAFQPVSVRPTTTLTRTLRRLGRSKVAMGALISATLIGLVAGGAEWKSRSDARRARAVAEAKLRLPTNLGLVSPSNRLFASVEAQESVLSALDSVLEVDDSDVVARNLRGTFLVDQGRVAEGAAEFKFLARVLPGDFSAGLADHFLACADGAAESGDLDLGAVPVPSTRMEKYLAGYHSLRGGEIDAARNWLNDPELLDLRHAVELALLIRIIPWSGMVEGSREERDAVIPLAKGVENDVRAMEVRFGGVSAMSAHLRSYSTAYQLRYQDALEDAILSLSLAPFAHPALQNAARTAQELDRPELAIKFLERAQLILPDYWAFQELEGDLHLEAGRFAKAREVYAALDLGEDEASVGHQAVLLANAWIREAWAFLERSPQRSRHAAEQALLAVRDVPADWDLHGELRAYANASLEGETSLIRQRLLFELSLDPLSRNHLTLLRDYWPASLSTEESSLALEWVEELLASVSEPFRTGTLAEDPFK